MTDAGGGAERPAQEASEAGDRIARRFVGHDPAGGADTGGTPWAGRQLTSTGFDGDTGAADRQLLALLTTAEVGTADPEVRDESDVRLVELVSRARLLVPVVAVAGETTEVNGLVSDATSDMAAVTLVAADGHRALPAFTSLATLAAWDAAARPVPVTAQRAAQAAIQEGCHEIVLDVGAPSYAVLRGSMVWSLAMGRPWTPPHRDPQVHSGVRAAVADEPAVQGVGLTGGPGGVLRLDLTLRPGLGAEDLQSLAARIGERIARDGEVRARIDALAFNVSAG